MAETDRLLQLRRLGGWVAGGLALTLVATVCWSVLAERRGHTLRLGAGSERGEAYAFGQALAAVLARHGSSVRIEVIATEGTAENVRLLEAGALDLAMAQADVEAPAEARLVSMLYPDVFQLVVARGRGITSFADLRGRRVALPAHGSGQWLSFDFLAGHFDIEVEDAGPLSGPEVAAAMAAGELDAMFRVRALLNDDIRALLKSGDAELCPIAQGEALGLLRPGCDAATIPLGIYGGAPAMPAQPVPTLSVQRLLLARAEASEAAVWAVTEALYERRRELLARTPLAEYVHPPRREEGTFVPLHPGARSYYDREQPSFFVEYADFVALLISMALMLGSGLWGLRSLILSQQKNLADRYAAELVELVRALRGAEGVALEAQRGRLLEMLSECLADLDRDRLNAEGFAFFSFTWRLAYDELEGHRGGEESEAGVTAPSR